ncbi:MAG: hypothetical protein LBT93_06315 [Treponema sp.]|jgi:hypothetical protein|nr:hypothetical protein [Treponema sp.]
MNIQGRHITDDEGRILILRGCNLAGNIPGEPEEAEPLFAEFRARGFTFARLFITWEALEPGEPGAYNEAYLAYLRKILIIAEKRGVSLFISPCRENRGGGEGLPAWLPEKIGLDNKRRDPSGPYAGATLSTLFFAGNSFAPEFYIDGVKAQEWLQERYLAAMRQCFRRLKNCTALAGWDAAGAPGRGFIGGKGSKGKGAGSIPDPFQVMAAASGYTWDIPGSGPGATRCRDLPRGISLFKPGHSCLWKQAGVWTDEGGSPRLLKGDYFDFLGGKPVSFAEDFLKPFMLRFIGRMREAREKTIFLIGDVPGEGPPAWSSGDPAGVARLFRYPMGKKDGDREGGRDDFSAGLTEMVLRTRERMGDIPSLAEAGDPRPETLSRYYEGLEKNLLHGILGTCGPNLPPAGIIRPYPMATAGIPLKIHWDQEKAVFTYRFRAEAGMGAPTEIYIPPAFSGGEPGISLREPDAESGAGAIRVFYDREQNKGIITHAGYRGDIEIAIAYS